jgi:hypothetical protein
MSENSIYGTPNPLQAIINQLGENQIEAIQDAQAAQTGENLSNTIAYQKQQIEKAKFTKDQITSMFANPSNSWPHAVGARTNTQGYQEFIVGDGFLPPILISPTIKSFEEGAPKPPAQYEYKDWRGALLVDTPNKLSVEQRFNLSKDIPKKKEDLSKSPYSMRDIPVIFSDYRQDYFKHGLQVIDNLGKPVTGIDGAPDALLSEYKGTPFENNDPVMFGFDIIIDAVSSPLLNGSVIDFITQYSSINEIAARRVVYEDFKNQFVKFFRTKGTVRIDNDVLLAGGISRTTTNPANLDANQSIFWPGKKAYMGYYLKKISGLDFLSESNKGITFKYLPDYRNEMITLEFFEDVSLSLGTLAHLYKLLYWSKPNGKVMIPENLLRFNCDIVISECRSFLRTRKDVSSGNLELVKDNLSRHVFQLRDCQFWFDKSVVPNDVDLGAQGPQVYDTHNVSFDFKYVAERFEKFVPMGNFGTYIGYNGGAIWKVGNAGERENRNLESGGSTTDSSTPKFLTIGKNPFSENGVAETNTPFIIKIIGNGSIQADGEENVGETPDSEATVEDLKTASEAAGKLTTEANKAAEASGLPSTNVGGNNLQKISSENSSNFIKSIPNIPGASGIKKALTENTLGKIQTTVNQGVSNLMANIRTGNIEGAKNALSVGAGGLKNSLGNAAINAAKDLIPGGGVGDLKSLISTNAINFTKDQKKNAGVADTRQNILNKTLDKVFNTKNISIPTNTNGGLPSLNVTDLKGQLINFAGPLGGMLG